MQDEENEYKEQLNQLNIQHKEAFAKIQKANEAELQEKEEIKLKLTEEIRDLEKLNKTVRDDKENEEWEKIDTIKEQNKEELMKVTTIGLSSKAELTLTNSNFTKKKKEKDTVQRELQELSNQLQTELSLTNNYKNEIDSQKNEIEE